VAENKTCHHVWAQQQNISGELFRQQPDPPQHVEEDCALLQQAKLKDLSVSVQCSTDIGLGDG